MAAATPGSQAFPDGLTWEVITPQRARAALLRRSVPAVEQPITALPRRQPQLAKTPSSPTNRNTTAVGTEGPQHATIDALPNQALQGESQPISIAESADRLVQAHTETYNTKLTIFRAFCAAFDETAKQFTSKQGRDFAHQFSNNFLDYWSHALNSTTLAPIPTYSSVAAGLPPSTLPTGTPEIPHPHHQRQNDGFPHAQLQGPATPLVRPAEDLRVFVRLEPEAQARTQTSYAIRTHVAQKAGINPQLIHAIPVATGWAIRPADAATRDKLLQQKEDWSRELGAINVEASQRWYKYVVHNCPRRLTDLHGNEVNYDTATLDEIKCQTGLEPVSVKPSRHDSNELPTKTLIVSFTEPTKRFWTLFGTSSPAALINKPQPPRQCTVCWDYHGPRGCKRLPICKTCGKPAHGTEACSTPTQCINCLAPHEADDTTNCLARPKRVHGMLRYLTREQKVAIRKIGRELFYQKNPESRGNRGQALPDGGETEPRIDQEAVPGQTTRPASPVDEMTVSSPSCIVVATTIEPEATEPEAIASRLKRRRQHEPAPSL